MNRVLPKLSDRNLSFRSIWEWARNLINTLEKVVAPDVPVGGMIFWPMPDPPLGWLSCDGATVNTSDYPVLFLALGNTTGSTFNLPNVASPIAEQVIIRARI